MNTRKRIRFVDDLMVVLSCHSNQLPIAVAQIDEKSAQLAQMETKLSNLREFNASLVKKTQNTVKVNKMLLQGNILEIARLVLEHYRIVGKVRL